MVAHPAAPADWPAAERAGSYYVAFRVGDAIVAKPFAAVKAPRCAIGSRAVAATPSFAKVALIGKGHLSREVLFGLGVPGELLLLLTVFAEYDSLAAPT